MRQECVIHVHLQPIITLDRDAQCCHRAVAVYHMLGTLHGLPGKHYVGNWLGKGKGISGIGHALACLPMVPVWSASIKAILHTVCLLSPVPAHTHTHSCQPISHKGNKNLTGEGGANRPSIPGVILPHAFSVSTGSIWHWACHASHLEIEPSDWRL